MHGATLRATSGIMKKKIAFAMLIAGASAANAAGAVEERPAAEPVRLDSTISAPPSKASRPDKLASSAGTRRSEAPGGDRDPWAVPLFQNAKSIGR